MRELVGVEPPSRVPPAPARVVIDLRPLQEPERTPITAAYLQCLLAAFAADPLPGESFVPVLRLLRPDPTRGPGLDHLAVAGRRRVFPTARFLRSAGLTVDAFQLRGAEIGSSHGYGAVGATGVLYHTAGGAVPLGSDLPVVATLLDLAPWELPSIYAASPAARFGHRLRARILRDARRLIVCSDATAEAARRLVRIRPERIAVVGLAAGDAFVLAAGRPDHFAGLRARLSLPPRYLVFTGRYDARKDLGTLFRALAALREESPDLSSRRRRLAQPEGAAATTAAGSSTASGPPRSGRGFAAGRGDAGDSVPWPPVVVLAGATGEGESDAPALARAAARHGVEDLVFLVPHLSSDDLATLEAGAEAAVFPAISEGTGLAVLEALAVGIPVVASRVGPLPELIGPAGIIVEPRDPARLAAALRAAWSGPIHAQLRRAARQRALAGRRTWTDVARETRDVYAAALVAD
ncbi:MAG: glycosyltransferase [Candidatus Limnocylindrales bacterium]|jgi:glycosyltransferase involved in cell wall biosynthesis